MSYIAAILLLYMEPYNAFVCLANMLNNYHFISFFRMERKEIDPYLELFEILLQFVSSFSFPFLLKTKTHNHTYTHNPLTHSLSFPNQRDKSNNIQAIRKARNQAVVLRDRMVRRAVRQVASARHGGSPVGYFLPGRRDVPVQGGHRDPRPLCSATALRFFRGRNGLPHSLARRYRRH